MALAVFRISTDEGFTGLFSDGGARGGPSAIERLIENNVPVTIGGRTLAKAELEKLLEAVKEAAKRTKLPSQEWGD